ncbi:hypothetical protein EXY23_23630 [Roseicella aquatilis]|uniref:Class I SAM-dependent methyltransferase n=1 Tax=Roseicella aquatilis TaxID=2527868 RepID=A0A4R4D498_9PROT|nr:hypothetical protein EXY23_23630 [Roseicella aquatilis]
MVAAQCALQWLARLWPSPETTAGVAPELVSASARKPLTAPTDLPDPRAAWSDRLWGAGFTLPGGEAEVLHLARLLPLSAATTLLLVGRDAGGAAGCLAGRYRSWIATYQHDARLVARMTPLLRPLGRRTVVQPWTPATPRFRDRYHHHALGLEPLHSGAAPDRLCQAVASALKPGGQLVLVETVASSARPVPGLARWLELDGRASPPPSRGMVESALQTAGFTVHVIEVLDMRQAVAVTDAWLQLLVGLRQGARPASTTEAAALVTEAERWLLWQRLLQSGDLVVLRWHATLPG